MKYVIAALVVLCFGGSALAEEMPTTATPDSVQKTQKQRVKHKKTKKASAAAASAS
ncbi:hypothetical protein JCM19000A_19380 [Silvimonas sp. JCM 19000]